MDNATIGLFILAAIVVIWIARAIARTGQAKEDAATGGANSYLDSFEQATSQLGIDPRSVTSDARFQGLLKSARETMLPHEFALHNALGHMLREQLRDPKPYPNDLHLAFVTASAWQKAGLVRAKVLNEAMTMVEQRLKARGLEL